MTGASRTVVVGGGIAGLVAARRRAIGGDEVVLLEAGPRAGGRVAPVRIGGALVDGGAESFATRGGAVLRLLGGLGLADDVVEPAGGAWVALPDRTVPLPAASLLGIPSSPLATDVMRVLDVRGSLRAYADRVLPVLKVGRYDRLGALVAGRMGRAVLDRLVAPVVENVYGAHPDDVPIDLVAPGLNGAITTTGTLSSAVLRLRAAAPPGSAAQGLRGGVHRLAAALLDDLAARGVLVRTEAPALGLHPRADGTWLVVTAREDVVADRVVLAADGAAALRLLADAAPELSAMPAPAPVISRAVLVAVDDARLDAPPRGSGVLRARDREGVGAIALTHVSAKWPWVREALPAGRHVLRLAYRGGEAVADPVVHEDLRSLLGLDVAAPTERVDVVWRDTAPPLDPATIAIRRALAAAVLPEGLALAGSWTEGTGLAAVVAGAERVGGAGHSQGTP